MIAIGGCIVQLDRFHPRTWWESVRESRATILHYLGVMPSMLLARRTGPERSRPSPCASVSAPAWIAAMHAAFEQRFGFPLLEAWADDGDRRRRRGDRQPRTAPRRHQLLRPPAAAVEVRIMPEDGELLVRAAGPDPRAGFFSEYLKEPETTEAAWEGGWFHTGDIVRCRCRRRISISSIARRT